MSEITSHIEEKIHDISKAVYEQLRYIKPQEKSAIVFDIDDTLMYSKNRQPIQPMINLYQYVLLRGFIPVIITARVGDEYTVKYTMNELEKLGVNNYRLLYFRKHDKQDPTKFKLNCRKVVHRLGYTVVMSIGDMEWDIGEYGGIGVLLPREERIQVF